MLVRCLKTAICLVGVLSVPNIALAQSDASKANDLKVLNYALTLEHLEAGFYNTFQSRYNNDDFIQAGYGDSTYDYFTSIQSHENAHVKALQATITGLGGTPVSACNYNLTAVNSVEAYVKVAQLLENTGVSAYDGALNGLSDSGLQEVAATIATVEARHAAFLNQLNKVEPFPDALDKALTPNQIIEAAKGFFIDCSGSVDLTANLPTVRPTGVTASTESPLNNNFVYSEEQKQNDWKALNYALVLEHLESAFYNQMQQRFNAGDFGNAGFEGSNYTYFELIRSHENAHVQALETTIKNRGGTPVTPCNYDFTMVTDVESYINTAKVLENTGVSAYDGAVNTISDYVLQQVAATIATVEARHAAYLNHLVDPTSPSPFPSALDTAVKPGDIIKAAQGFFVNCPFDITDANILPQVAPANSNVGSTPPAGTGGSDQPANPTPIDSSANSIAIASPVIALLLLASSLLVF